MGNLLFGVKRPESRFDLLSNEKSSTPYLSLLTGDGTYVTSFSQSHVDYGGSNVSASLGYDNLRLTYDPAGRGAAGEKITTTLDLTSGSATGQPTRAAVNVTGGPSAGAGIYLRLGSGSNSIAGDSQNKGYENWIKIDSAQFGMGLSYSPQSGSRGGILSQPSISELTWTQQFDATLPAILANLARGTGLPNATIEYVKDDGKDGMVTVAQLVLEDVLFSGLSLSSSGDRPLISASINFSAFSQTVYSVDKDGKRNAGTTFGYDIVRGKPVTNSYAAASPGVHFGAGNLYGSVSQAGSIALPSMSQPIPEPQTWLMMLAGVGVLLGATRRRAAT